MDLLSEKICSFLSNQYALTDLQQQIFFFYFKKIGDASTFTRENLHSINPASKHILEI